MIVIKNLRVDVLAEPIFEKVNLVIQPGERVGIIGSNASDVSTFLRVLAGAEDPDEGKVLIEKERVAYMSAEGMRADSELITEIHAAKPTFVFLDAAEVGNDPGLVKLLIEFVAGFRGGILIASEDSALMSAAKITRMLEIDSSTKLVTSFTGQYTAYLVEREKNETRVAEAYKKQQKEKKRLEEWLEQKRKEAAIDRSPSKGNTIRTKKKYLQREILAKEIPKPKHLEESENEE